MPNARALSSLVASLLLVAHTASAQVTLPLKLDLEPAVTVFNPSDPPAGYTVMLKSKLFVPGSYGWESAPGTYSTSATHVSPNVLVQLGSGDSQEYLERVKLLRDGHTIASSNVFRASLTPNAKVRVRVTLGQLNTSATTRGMRIYASSSATPETLVTRELDPEVAGLQGLWSRTLIGKATLGPLPPATNYGGYRVIWFVASADASGVLALRMEASSGYQVAVSGIEIYPYSPPPLVLVSPHTGLVTNDDYTAGMSPSDVQALYDGAAALNDGNTSAAETAFRAIANDPFAEATGLLWVAGWLGGEQLGADEGKEWSLALEALASLQGLTNPSDLVAEYLDHAREYRRAYKHWRLRGYTGGLQFAGESPTANPFQSNEALLDNLNISEALWRNVGAQQIGAVVENPQIEIHPLFMKGCEFLGANWYSRSSPNNWKTTTEPLYTFNKQHFSLWKEFASGFGATIFAESDELRVMSHMATYDGDDDGQEDYDEDVPGSIIDHWKGEGADVVHGEGATKWWDTPWLHDAQQIAPSSDSDWAGHQRRAREALLGGHRWWIDERYKGGEFGGGSGDDVELLLLHVSPVFPIRNNEDDLLSLARTIIDKNLAPWDVGGTGKYFFGDGSAGSADIEHTGEFTGNPLFVALQFFWGDPYYLEYETQSLQHVASNTLGQPWTESVSFAGFPVTSHTYPYGGSTPPIAYRRFLAWHLDAEGPSYTAVDAFGTTIDTHGDVSLNGRALLPAWYVNAYNQNPEAKRLMREWAEWWWTVAMDDGSALSTPSTMGPKPKGVLPALAIFDGTAARPLLYGEPGVTPNDWWTGGYEFKGALSYSYFIYSGLFLERYLDPQTPASERSDYLRPIWESSKLVAEYWRQTCHGCDLGTPITQLSGSPSTPGTTWWTASQMIVSDTYMKQVAQALPYLETDPTISALTLHADQITYLQEALAVYGPSYATALIDGNKQPVVDEYRANFDWLDACFPIGTNFVAFTDRAFLWSGDTLYSTFNSSTGGYVGALPLYIVDWERTTDVYGIAQGTKLKIASYVKGIDSVPLPSGATPRLTVLLTNYETAPNGAGPTRDAVLRLWHQLPHGRYHLEYGPNDGNDGIASVQYLSPSFDFVRPGTARIVPIPYADSAATPKAIVVQLTREGDAAEPRFADAAVGARDIAVNVNASAGTTTLEVTFHGLGTQSTAAPFEIWGKIGSGAPFLALSGSVNLGAVTGLTPQKYTVTRVYPFVVTGATVKVDALLNTGPATDGNVENDSATRSFTFP